MTRLQDWVAVLGGGYRYTESQITAAFVIGREVGRMKRHVVTGATTGVSYAAALGAKSVGALVAGLSPASDPQEHTERYKKPSDGLDVLVYTGMGFEGRSPLIIRSAASAIFVGGEFGTLNEFTSAWMSGKVIGVLEGAGGITDQLKSLCDSVATRWGCVTIFDPDPVKLVHQVLSEVERADRRSVQEPTDIGSDVRDAIDRFLASESRSV